MRGSPVFLYICVIQTEQVKNLCKSVKSVGKRKAAEKICVICEICVTKKAPTTFVIEAS